MIWHRKRFLGIRLGRHYFKARDTNLHPLRFSERNLRGYRTLVRIGSWELGVRRAFMPIDKPLEPPKDPSNKTC